MTRNYTVTEIVGRPKKYTQQDFKDIITKVKSDKKFAKEFKVSKGTIQGIRTNQSKKLKISIKNKWKNQKYGGIKMPMIKQLKPSEFSYARKVAELEKRHIAVPIKGQYSEEEKSFINNQFNKIKNSLQAEVNRMAEKKTKKSKGKGRLEQVKDYLKKNPKASNKDICTALKLHPSYLFTLKKKL